MEDDIDIEEHDVLDNPRIKDIFPDLSKIKTEIIDDDDVPYQEYDPYLPIKEEVEDIEEYQEYDTADVTEADNLVHPIVSDVELGYVHNNHDEIVIDERIVVYDTETVDNDVDISEVNQQIYPVQNVAPEPTLSVINGSGGSCSKSLYNANINNSDSSHPVHEEFIICDTYGFQDNTLDESQIDTVSTNEIDLEIFPEDLDVPKEHLPAFVVLKDWGSILKTNPCYCDSCKILFPTVNCLDSHKMSAHSFLVAFTNRTDDVGSESDSEIDYFSGNSTACSIPPNSIRDNVETNRRVKKRKLSNGIEESVSSSDSLLNVPLNIKNTENSKISGEQCFHCDQIFTDSSALIKHLYDQVDSIRFSKDKDNTQNCLFKCKICNETFSNEVIAKFHSRFMHSEISLNVIEKCVAKGEKNAQTTKESIREATAKSNKTNEVKTDKEEVENSLLARFSMKKQNYEFTFMKNVVVKNPPIPINVLFKCSKCDMHVITGHFAYNHSTVCNGNNKHFDCQKCKRKFRPCDEEMHELQHLVTKSFKAYVYQNSLIKRLLCRCPKCNICFSERLFWQHLMRPCVKIFVYCNKCNLNINKETYTNTGHKDCGDNIIIDYIDDLEKFTFKSVGKGSSRQKKCIYRLWCCEACQMCGKINVKTHNCNSRYKSFCHQCGLYFCPKVLVKHKDLHLEQSLNLHNFLLYSVEKRKFIQPSMPRYKICANCELHYLKWHKSCINKIFKTCEICEKKFEIDHYEIHKQFHIYDLDRIVNETVHNGGYVGFKSTAYIFQCIKCKCFVHNYDQVVYHARNHIKKISQQRKYCEKCDKMFDAATFKGHTHNLGKSNILKFDYTKFFSDGWFDVFDCLDQVEIGSILMDCLFKDTRSFDLTWVQKGQSDKTLYVCSSCNIIVEKAALEKHMSNKMYCWNNKKYKCKICDLYFYSPGVMEAHKRLHSIGVNKEDFCIISVKNINIASKSVAELEKPMVSKTNETCNRLVLQKEKDGKKNVWRQKTLADSNKSKIDSEIGKDNQSGNDSDSSEREKCSDKNDTKELILYKCMDCTVCIFSCVYYENHCCKTKYMQFCHMCKQFYHKANWVKHNLIMHNHNRKIEFILKDFRTKVNEMGRPQRYIVKVSKMIYDVSNVTGFKAKLMGREETTKVVKDKVSIGGILETNAEENKEIDTVSRTDSNAVKSNTPRNQIIKDIVLYKCVNCKTCIIRHKSIACHMCSIDFYKRFCDYCQQWFSIVNWERHNNMIHNFNAKPNILIKYFKPKQIVYGKRAMKMLATEEIDNIKMRKAGSSDQTAEAEHVIQVNDDLNDSTPQSKDIKENIVKNKKDMVTIFKCSNCNVCILNKRSNRSHVCHKALKLIHCTICKQTYSSNSFHAHRKSFCKGNKINLNVKYFKPATKGTLVYRKNKTMFAPKPNKIHSKASTYNNDKENCMQNNNKKAAKKNNNKINVVMYKCLYCQICIRTTKWNYHRCVVDIFKKYCQVCKQLFPMQNFFRHARWHQRTKNINVIIKHFKPVKQCYSSMFKDIAESYQAKNRQICTNLKNRKGYATINAKKSLGAHGSVDNGRQEKFVQGKRTKIIKSLKTNTTAASEVLDKDSQFNNKTPKIKITKSYSDDEDYEPNPRVKKAIKATSGISSELNRLNNYVSLYLCTRCNVHFIHDLSRKSHIYRKHNQKGRYGFAHCCYCKLRFSCPSLKNHQNHCPLKFKGGYIEIIDLNYKIMRIVRRVDDDVDLPINEANDPSKDTANEDDELAVDSCEDTNLTAISNVSNETDDTDSMNVNDTESVESLNRSNEYSETLNITEKSVSDNKMSRTIEEVKSMNICNGDILKVTNDSNSMNNKDANTNKINENAEVEKIVKCDENSKQNINTNANDEHNTVKSNLNNTHHYEDTQVTDSKKIDENIALEFQNINETPEVNSKKNTNEYTDNNVDNTKNVDQPCNTRDTINEPNDSAPDSTVIPCESKLFSCGACEVYFIKAECCQAHLKNHTKLDPRFYIQCKLCMLQFLVVDLYVHMVTHHGDGIKFENLVIEESIPNDIQPRIYKLKDKLQSVIISTTSAECD